MGRKESQSRCRWLRVVAARRRETLAGAGRTNFDWPACVEGCALRANHRSVCMRSRLAAFSERVSSISRITWPASAIGNSTANTQISHPWRSSNPQKRSRLRQRRHEHWAPQGRDAPVARPFGGTLSTTGTARPTARLHPGLPVHQSVRCSSASPGAVWVDSPQSGPIWHPSLRPSASSALRITVVSQRWPRVPGRCAGRLGGHADVI